MSRNLLALLVVFGTVACAADLPEKWAKRMEAADSTYHQAVQAADNTRFYAVQKANAARVKAFRQVLTEATKAGDFDAATAIKERVAAAEKDGIHRDKPKGTVKFAGHEYAMISERVTWHVAKRMCEEMGGHLATCETADEAAYLQRLCAATDGATWFGASDEAEEGDWHWITGPKVGFDFVRDNAGDSEHYLGLYGGTWNDLGDARFRFVCEWDN